MFKRRLSQVLGAITKGYAVDTLEGGFPVKQEFITPAALGAASVLASTALTASSQTITTNITNPDVYRCVSIVGNAAGIVGNVVVTGTNWADRVISDTIALNATTTVKGVKAFKTITSIVLPALTTAGDEVSVGLTNKLGLYRDIEASTDVSSVFIDTTREVAVKQVDTVTITGTSGTANITVAGGLTKLLTFDTDLGTTASNFVTAFAADYLEEGIVVTSDDDDLIFTALTAGTAFDHPVITNATGDLAGSVANTTANVAEITIDTTNSTVETVTALNGSQVVTINYLTKVF